MWLPWDALCTRIPWLNQLGRLACCIITNTYYKCKVWVIQSGLTLCDPMYCSLPGSSVHGILQARILLPTNLGLTQSFSKSFQCEIFSLFLWNSIDISQISFTSFTSPFPKDADWSIWPPLDRSIQALVCPLSDVVVHGALFLASLCPSLGWSTVWSLSSGGVGGLPRERRKWGAP